MANEYSTYVVRVWVADQKRPLPKIVVENPHTGSKVSFNNWENLVAFLQAKSARFRGGADGENSNKARGSGTR